MPAFFKNEKYRQIVARVLVARDGGCKGKRGGEGESDTGHLDLLSELVSSESCLNQRVQILKQEMNCKVQILTLSPLRRDIH